MPKVPTSEFEGLQLANYASFFTRRSVKSSLSNNLTLHTHLHTIETLLPFLFVRQLKQYTIIKKQYDKFIN